MSLLSQTGHIFGVNFTGTSSAEGILYISANENPTGNYISNKLHIRLQVTNDDTNTDPRSWNLYYNTINNPDTAIQVTTGSNIVKIVDDTDIADGTALTNEDAIGDPGFFWQPGEYSETTDSDALELADGFYTDFQWCIQFDNTVELGIPYYFFLRFNGTVLDTYPGSIEDIPTVILAEEKVRYVNTNSTPAGDGTTNATTGDNRAYASLNEWEAAEQDDLRPFYILNIVYCSGDAPDTTSVNIIGWTTSATDGIFVTGDEDSPSGKGRHFGIAETGYSLEPSAGTNILLIQESYVTIDGIEIFDANGIFNILVDIARTAITQVTFKNCILHGTYGSSGMGIRMNNSGSTYAYNNIIYDLTVVLNHGAIRTHDGTHYIYNNTIAHCITRGIRHISGTTVVKNNLVVDCDNDCYWTLASFGSGSNYNASDDDTSTGGAQDRTNQTFSFVNDRSGFGGLESNPSTEVADYHLVWFDTGALGHGISLANDSALSFTTDIDGDIRGDNNPSVGIWDIGADEFSGFYRGSSSSSSSSSTSSSSSSQSSSSSADNPYKIVRYINTDSTAGGTGTTNATIGDDKAYPSMTVWAAAEERNLVLENEHHVVYCSGSVPDIISVTIADWTTSSTRNILIIGLGRADFSGKITDIRIYNKGLTQAEAIALYKTSAQIDDRGDLWC